MKRRPYDLHSVLAWMRPNETYKDAESRLNHLRKIGQHPAQLKKEKRHHETDA